MDQGKQSSAMSPLVDFGAVCQKVREAVEPARVHAVSLHDSKGEVLWLTESSMGPDEHNAAREAFEAFSSANGPPVLDYDLGDSRSAVLFRAVNSRRSLVGAIMIVMDSRGIKQIDKGAARLMNPKLQKVLSEFAGMRPEAAAPIAAAPTAAPSRPAAARAPAPKAPPTRTPQAASAAAAPSTVASAMARVAPASTAPARAAPASAAPARAAVRASGSPPVAAARAAPAGAAPPLDLSLADSVRTARPPAAPARAAPAAAPVAAGRAAPAPVAAARAAPASAAVRTPDAAVPDKRQSQSVTPEIDRLHAALRKSPIALHVQRLVPLAKGSQLRRYEVLLRSKSEDAPNSAPHAMLKAAVENGLGSMIDRRVVTELIGWLVHHPDVWQKRAVLFSVNLTSTALHDEHFMKFVELCLMKSSLPKAMIAFEVDVPTAILLGDKIADVAAALHRLGCPMVLDDFGMRTECFDLLRLPAVRYVKIASEITAKMRSDKVSQAAITAVVQMARVLGMHTVAKRTETAAEQEWLTALGVDFIQSNALSPPVAIESLSTVQKPPPNALTK
jgi:EAL domain-containing protein (putative c-di-GMP-specific phosphodiesterase class I)